MGHVNAPMILGTLGVIEVGLKALGIPHGKGGTEAAIEWLGESVGREASFHRRQFADANAKQSSLSA